MPAHVVAQAEETVATPRYSRRLSDKIRIAFHQSCDQADYKVAQSLLVPPVIDSAVDFRIDGSAMTEMHRDRETDCREEVCGDAQR